MTKDDRIKPGIQKQIDENLKRVYDDMLQGELPDRFRKLLDDLRARDPKQ